MNNNCGIYKITSPSGKIYVGQSKELNIRKKKYSKMLCKGQRALYNSLVKYGWEAHTFNVIHYCEKDELDCIERYYQELFETTGINGLNCVLTKCGLSKNKSVNSKTSELFRKNSGMAKKVINTNTMEVYLSATYAFESSEETSYTNFKNKLNQKNRNNNTYFMYLEDYEKYGKVAPKEKKGGFQKVINTLTKEVFDSVFEAAKSTNISNLRLARYLSKNDRNNKTFFLYLKDYKGEVHFPIVSSERKEIIDVDKEIVYRNKKEASKKLNKTLDTIRWYMSGKSKDTFFMYYEDWIILQEK